MEGKYTVTMGSECVGEANVIRQGLYWHITCRCSLSGQVLHRVLASCDEQEENLGVLIPQGECFSLSTKVPVKRLKGENLRFRVIPKHVELQGRFVPLRPEEPFRYIERLKTAYLQRRGGELGVVITRACQSSSSNPTGQ